MNVWDMLNAEKARDEISIAKYTSTRMVAKIYELAEMYKQGKYYEISLALQFAGKLLEAEIADEDNNRIRWEAKMAYENLANVRVEETPDPEPTKAPFKDHYGRDHG